MKNLLKRLKIEPTPLVDGESVTFVWQGKEKPTLRGDFSHWQTVPAAAWQAGPRGYWSYQLDFPGDAYIEYCFGADDSRQVDPNNPRLTSNGMGFMNNYFYMPDAGVSGWSIRDRSVLQGSLSRVKLETLGMIVRRRRTVHFYQPPVEQPVPLLLVYDGRDYRNRAKLPVIVDNLIAAGRMAPVALAMLPNAALGRMSEYACSESMLLFLQQQLLPAAREHLNLLPIEQNPAAYGVLGASMGGLMSLFTTLRLPHIFGRAYCQSGSFELGPYQSVVFELLKQPPQPAPRLYLDVGRYEWLLEPNRRMRTALYQADYNFAYHEFNAGHNYPAWRDNLHRGLSWLFAVDGEEAAGVPANSKRAVNIWGKEFRKV